MTINDFVSLFTGIRVKMDWQLLLSKNPQVTQSLISTRADLGKLITVCRDKNGSDANGYDNDAEACTVNTKKFPPLFETELSQNQNASAIPNNFYLPVYEIHNDHLILDGNHRAVALYRSGVTPNLSMLSIQAPICSKILPDLGKWE